MKPRRWHIGGAAAMLIASFTPAASFRIELKDVAPDRIERQRAEAIGQIPLPGTPNVAQFNERLREKGFAVGSAMFIRVFKAESELEVWLQKGDTYELFATYPICHWSGTLGPKISEGDKQTPEGVYTVSLRQVHQSGRHPKALNLGFPNAFDKQFQRTGSYILIHGGCGSVGCFAMTNPVIDEIYTLAHGALKSGQDVLHVHTFPFRMTEARLRAYALNDWYDFWRNLKDIYDRFEQTKRPPKVSVCEGRYWVHGTSEREVASQGPLAVCGAPQAAASSNGLLDSVSLQTEAPFSPYPRPQQVPLLKLPPISDAAPIHPVPNPSPKSENGSRRFAARATAETARAQPLPVSNRPSGSACNTGLPSCRRMIALEARAAARREVTPPRVAVAPSRGAALRR